MAAIEIPEAAIRDAVAAYMVVGLGDNASTVLREMLATVLESKGSHGRTELQNMIIDQLSAMAKKIIEEMVENNKAQLEGMVREALEKDFIPKYVEYSLQEIAKKFTRGW